MEAGPVGIRAGEWAGWWPCTEHGCGATRAELGCGGGKVEQTGLRRGHHLQCAGSTQHHSRGHDSRWWGRSNTLSVTRSAAPHLPIATCIPAFYAKKKIGILTEIINQQAFPVYGKPTRKHSPVTGVAERVDGVLAPAWAGWESLR